MYIETIYSRKSRSSRWYSDPLCFRFTLYVGHNQPLCSKLFLLLRESCSSPNAECCIPIHFSDHRYSNYYRRTSFRKVRLPKAELLQFLYYCGVYLRLQLYQRVFHIFDFLWHNLRVFPGIDDLYSDL